MDVEQRAALVEFLSLVDRSGECHIWMGARMARDYGFFKKRLATHWALEFAGFGRPSSSHGALHTCDNPCCVNPEHLKWGTQKENAADASQRMRYPNSRKTHCPKGHEYTAQNTIHRARKQGWKDRHCRECDMIRKREYRARRAMLAARPEGI